MRIPTIVRSGEVDAAPVEARLTTPDEVRLEAVPAPLAGQVFFGVVFSIITLGIYRFWYRTGLRRYYWGNTRLADDRFEYTGTGMELFIGFLIAIAIVIPLYLVIALFSLLGGAILGPLVASLLGAIVMPALVQILVFRARRYRLVRTWYRGVRFHQSGSGVGYLLRTVKWLLLTALTLGIVYPYLRRALERYKTEHTWYGSVQGAFSAPVKPIMKVWLLVWGLMAALAVCTALVPVAAMSNLKFTTLGLTIVVLAMALLLPIIWQWYRVREFRTFIGGTRIGAVTLTSDLAVGAVLWVWLSYYLMLLAMLIGLIGLVVVASPQSLAGLSAEDLEAVLSSPSLVFSFYGSLVVLIFGGAILTELYLRRRIWALRARSITAGNLASLEQVIRQAGQDSLAVGEAFDSGFDIAG
jgi:uncharacterized membrane protein YjgN (DUF898 family)